MSKYQSQKRSQSKNGGRGRRKSTMRKLRRGRKSRKVMRGGGDWNTGFDNKQLSDAFVKYAKQPDGVWLRNTWVIPKVQLLTKYKNGDTTFWDRDDALMEALSNDKELNSNINTNNTTNGLKYDLSKYIPNSPFYRASQYMF
jgi:hypothetical protein